MIRLEELEYQQNALEGWYVEVCDDYELDPVDTKVPQKELVTYLLMRVQSEVDSEVDSERRILEQLEKSIKDT